MYFEYFAATLIEPPTEPTPAVRFRAEYYRQREDKRRRPKRHLDAAQAELIRTDHVVRAGSSLVSH
jgi:predicted alpha/beta-hydrolase family hydrolase